MSATRDAWITAQKRAFTGWMNIQLAKRNIPPVNDIFTDLEDGVALCQLAEIILDCKIKYTPRERIKMVYPKLENINFALQEMKKKVFVSAEPAQIRSGDPRMILGMLWTLILRIQVSEVSIEQKTAKEGLLLWCQRKTAGYRDVAVRDFTNSWKDGLALCALIHKHYPALIPFDTLTKANAVDNLNMAFEIALREWNIPKMLDANEMVQAPDELSVVTYLTQFFHAFSKSAQSEVASRRVTKLVELTQSNDDMKADYERKATELVAQLKEAIAQLEDRSFDNTLAGAIQKMKDFESFKSSAKPALTSQKLEVETIMGSIAMKLRTCGRPPFHPAEEIALPAIEALYAHMEEEEAKRGLALREELMKQKKLASAEAQFEGKISGLEHWVADKKIFLDNDNLGDTLGAVQNSMKMQEAFEDEFRITRQAREVECERLADEMLGLHYQEAQISERLAALKASLDALHEQSQKRKAALEQAREREVEKERLRKEFAAMANDAQRWLRDTQETIQDHTFPEGLQAITEYRAKLDADNATIQSTFGTKLAAMSELDGRMTAAGITDNKYTALRMSDMNTANDSINESIAKRDEAYRKELEHQQNLEERRVEFAQKATAFDESLAAMRSQIEALAAAEADTLEARIEKVTAAYGKGAALEAPWDELGSMDRQNSSVGITSNTHTTLTIAILGARKAQLGRFVETTLGYLNDQIFLRDRSAKEESEIAAKEKRDAACIDFAQKAIAMNTYMESIQSALAAPMLDTETLGDAQQLKEQFETVVLDGHQAQKPAFEELRQSHERVVAEGVTANPFCHLTMEALAEKWESLEKSLDERKDRVAQELERQEVCEGLRRTFAEKATALAKFCADHKKAFADLAGDLQTQLTEAKSREAEIDAAKDEIVAEVQKIAQELSEMNVTINEHTDLDVYTVKAMYEALVNICKRSVGVLEQRLVAQKMGDITPEELAEFRECFDHFDQDHSGDLQRLEFKACLASLGQEVADEQLETLWKQMAGDRDCITFDSFTQYMKNRTKDTDSKEEVVASFKEIAKDKPFVTADDLRGANLEAKHVEYLSTHMPPKEAGFDYEAFTEQAFTR